MGGIGRRCAVLVVVVGVLGGPACAPGSPSEPAAARRGAIYGGSLDTEHLAVMALGELVDATHARGCSGTTIARRGGDAFFLTAAHCVVERDAANTPSMPLSIVPPSRLRVIPAADWAAAFNTDFHPVAAAFVHPRYAPLTGGNDVAVVRYTGATAATPTIPILEPAEDMLRRGSPITLVGYGQTESDTQATVRRKVDRAINVIGTAGFDYSQVDGKGSCFGDSGGPALFDSGAGVYVAGVMVRTVEGCQTLGLSTRASVASPFIHSVIDPTAAPDGGQDGGATDGPASADAQTTADAPVSTDARDATADAQTPPDAPVSTDAHDATADAQTTADAPVSTDAHDATAPDDAAPAPDAQGSGDAGTPLDAAASADAVAADASTPDGPHDAGASAPDGPRDASAPVDAGGDGRPEAPSAGGCGCNAGADSSPSGVGALLLAIAAAMAVRRRRANRRPTGLAAR